MHLASFSKKILEPISKNITGFYTGNLDQFSIDRSEQLMKQLQEELDKQIQELEKVKSPINAPNESYFALIDELKVEERKSTPKSKVNMKKLH